MTVATGNSHCSKEAALYDSGHRTERRRLEQKSLERGCMGTQRTVLLLSIRGPESPHWSLRAQSRVCALASIPESPGECPCIVDI